MFGPQFRNLYYLSKLIHQRLLQFIVTLVTVVALGGVLSSNYNVLVDLEERLEAQHEQTRNVFASNGG